MVCRNIHFLLTQNKIPRGWALHLTSQWSVLQMKTIHQYSNVFISLLFILPKIQWRCKPYTFHHMEIYKILFISLIINMWIKNKPYLTLFWNHPCNTSSSKCHNGKDISSVYEKGVTTTVRWCMCKNDARTKIQSISEKPCFFFNLWKNIQ